MSKEGAPVSSGDLAASFVPGDLGELTLTEGAYNGEAGIGCGRGVLRFKQAQVGLTRASLRHCSRALVRPTPHWQTTGP